ncbi:MULTISPECIES: low molecular weight protein-tyrosine-phosphatase [unclassified Pseudomonas]|uniref:low molecular weight protein-tyrosine-phosphatase n=1 Tax=unclassified Pseudomonas TaxID=196821 RepID=UPI002AC970C1|nr:MULTISPECIES: low molecular weight protein-tyrosine-phosphatase [unclassified Pseudomonas]MEB0042403.1 low molecular weight protein-tyrosine-phosphatase [Pseudomonas sp. MH10]MEB0079176.1 low molecular weight protein-tyrosine-phosphatase [Pseudomonas sp. MH10out]MEB0092380.1 low molecular weight protein-tyrosine-phosphatase [Pseudomonas sp. CCI4.2]MEB0102121.1 low molecular weight protein-tyrosine-phosphatase [Pseudomonas sp. CCI3.2]MEB0122106.1 low molecular weight protein-tyrosine-phospha
MFNNLLVICVGNICRSPMAEAMFRQRLMSTDVQVSSAGIHAMLASPMDPLAREVLKTHDITAHKHRARQVDRQMLHDAELILLMENEQVQNILKLAPEVRGKTFLIGKWQHELEIADPYRRPKLAFEQTFEHLSRCVDDWLPYLQSE